MGRIAPATIACFYTPVYFCQHHNKHKQTNTNNQSNTHIAQEKLGIPSGPQQDVVVQDMVRAFVEGICWVMAYYYDGVASWTWYYPYHYAPFASDMHSIAGMQPTFELGEPFKPFNQLMGVLPAASRHCLPEVRSRCMMLTEGC